MAKLKKSFKVDYLCYLLKLPDNFFLDQDRSE